MCNKCDVFEKNEIRAPEELYNVANYFKEAVRDGVLIEVKKEANEFSLDQTNLCEIERGKPWPSDIIEVYLKCVACGNEIELFCDTYHGGGNIKIVKPN